VLPTNFHVFREMSTKICTECSVNYTSVKGSKVDVANMCRPCCEKLQPMNEMVAKPLLKWIDNNDKSIT